MIQVNVLFFRGENQDIELLRTRQIMARAKRHYLPGQVWHITHRCHKKDFLLKLKMDRQRWLHWLYEARKRYGLTILDYTVTSNHIHLLVFDDQGRDVIPQSIKLVAGRTGQEYNSRKNRKGAFWEDSYHATAIQTKQHLLRCIVYIDLNMVRAGVVSHPSEWQFGGYNEIQKPRRKCVLIAYEKLAELSGFSSCHAFQKSHKEYVDEALCNVDRRQAWWSESIAVGDESFVEIIKHRLGIRSKGRKVKEAGESYQLREDAGIYIANSDPKNCNIDRYMTLLAGDNYVNTEQ
nr:transposase [Desulfosediminicola ganghwensis]